jgi:hypothetical protein
LDRKVIVLPTTTPDTASSSWERTWMGRTLPAAVLVFVIAACFAGIAIISNKSAILKEHSPRQDGIEALVRQVSSLHQSDFIVFSDGRVWYVRGVHDGNWRSSAGLATIPNPKKSLRSSLQTAIFQSFVGTIQSGPSTEIDISLSEGPCRWWPLWGNDQSPNRCVAGFRRFQSASLQSHVTSRPSRPRASIL